MPVAEWDCAELDSRGDLSDCLAELQEHCDALEESARYQLEMVSAAGDVLATTVHRCQPYRAANADGLKAGDSSPNTLVAMLVRHLENREKLLAGHTQISLGAIGTMLQNMQRLMELNGTEMRSLREQNSALMAHLQARSEGEDAEESEHERAESIARTRALEKLSALAPEVLAVVLQRAGIDPRMGGHNGSA